MSPEALAKGDWCRFRSGAVAQLGERELCKLEVVGSIPIGSTILLRATRFAGTAPFANAKQDALRSLGEAGPVQNRQAAH